MHPDRHVKKKNAVLNGISLSFPRQKAAFAIGF
jgi:hypothetical protein